jgi:hypothetical protein
MRAVLLKDLKVSCLWLSGVALFYPLTAVSVSRFGQALFWLGICLVAALVGTVPALEWRFEAERFVCSLPVTRAAIVRARMAAALLGAAVGLALWLASGLALEAVLSRPASFALSWASLEGILAFSLSAVVGIALFFPCYFRFGLGKGSGVFALLAIALAGAIVTIAPVVIGAGGGAWQPADPTEVLRRIVAGGRARIGAPGTVLVAIGGCATLLWVSTRLSSAFYERREL